MMNRYTSPNKKTNIKLHVLPLMATSLFSALSSQAQEVPNLFATDDKKTITPQSQTTDTKKKIFENTQDAEKMVFDIYAAGRFQGSALVNYTDDWVELNAANDILDQMPKVKNAELFLPLLTGKIESNVEKKLEGVGGVKVEPELFRINISIDEQQAVRRAKKLENTLENTADHVSFSSRIRVTGSTDLNPESSDPIGLTQNFKLSRGSWNLNAHGNYAKNAGYDFTGFTAQHIVGHNTYSAGMLSTNSVNYVEGNSFYGFRMQSTPPQGNSNEKATPIEIFVPSRATVRIYRNDNQIIYSGEHEFGLTTIDTSRFPTGSYNIRIAINEELGDRTEEQRFFQKYTNIIAEGKDQYSFSVGIQRNGFNLLTSPVYEFVYKQRVLDRIQLTTSVIGVNGNFAIEPKITGSIGNDYNYNASLTYSSLNDLAFAGRIQYSPTDKSKKLSWSANIQQTLLGHEYENTEIDEFSFERNIAGKNSHIQANLHYRLETASWTFSAQRTKAGNSRATYSFGPAFTKRLYKKNGHRLNFNARSTHTKNATDNALFFQYKYKPPLAKWNYTSNAGLNSSKKQTAVTLTQALAYSNRGINELGTSFNAYNSLRLKDDTRTRSMALGLEHDAKNVAMSVNYANHDTNKSDNEETIDYTLDTTFIAMQDDILNHEKRSTIFSPSKGGKVKNIIIKLSGNAVGENMEININGRPKFYSKVGETSAFSLTGFTGGNLTIKPSNNSASLLNYETEPVKFSILAGNIAQHEWVINKVFLLMGRAVDSNNKPIAWQRIEGVKDYTTTDSNGYFQMEVLGNETPYIQTNKHQCVLALPIIDESEPYKQIGDIPCE